MSDTNLDEIHANVLQIAKDVAELKQKFKSIESSLRSLITAQSRQSSYERR